MRILISLFRLAMGGSQINAIEIAANLARRGHEPIIYAPDGPLRESAEQLGLEVVLAGAARDRHPPTIAGVRALTDLAGRRQIGLIHAYEWSPTLEAAYGPHRRLGVPLLSTVYSVGLARGVPKRTPLIVGFSGDAEAARRRGWQPVWVVECPVDTDANAPVTDSAPARRRLGIAGDELAVVMVSRLAADLKREGLLSAARAVTLVPEHLRMRLLIVGDGPCRPEVAAAAEETNTALGREAVTLAGELLDPRDAYAAADVVLGMGTSAVKGMAFAKPVVIQGERGYWQLLTPETLPFYLAHNFYGVGDGTDGAPRLARIIADLAADRAAWPKLAQFGRENAVSIFSNEVASARVLEICEEVASVGRQRMSLADLAVPTVFAARHHAIELVQRLRGR